MSALESEVIEKFYQLDKQAQLRVRAVIEQETALEDTPVDQAPFDFDEWVRDIEMIREDIKASHQGVFPKIDVVEMLREIRN